MHIKIEPQRTPPVTMSSLPPIPQVPDPFAPLFITDVFTYKTVEGTPLQTDVHVPKDIKPGEDLPVLLLMHGGSLIAGHRRMWPLLCGPWLATFTAMHKAIVVVPDYRLAPETKTPEILADLVSFWEWVHGAFPSLLQEKRSVTPDLSKLAIYGESAGGWCALHLSLLYPQDIRASALPWPLVDTESEWFSVGSGNSMVMGMPPFPKDQTENHLASMNMDAVTTQGGPDRLPIAIGGMQHGFAHTIWGKSEETFVLRALERGGAKLPEFVWIAHGKDDTAVPLEGSEKLVRLIKTNSANTSVRFDVKPGDHGFANHVPFEEEWLQEALKEIAAVWLA
ncbi:unnamed protein product [Periconia digitata]|uniref:Alpha/beta hydrolase fold-3 domain-containing protein n=1 Tax=Periconia digitata TaxID=1303443 RepID=A0A9W4U014_9PLEO|nr:unnamed protein product [Periconia digitata]